MDRRVVSTCYRNDKRTFPSQYKAREWIDFMRVQDVGPDVEKLRPYQCLIHGGWHIGRVA